MKFNRKKHISHGTGNNFINNFKSVGNNVIIEEGVRVFHPENILVGDNVYIGHNTILKGYHNSIMVIGTDTWIGQGCFIHSAGGLEIGRSVGIGPMVKIITSAHMDNNIEIPVLFHDLKFKKVIIEDGADIGVGAIILPGVKIGEGSVVGAGSVVTKNVKEYTIVTGVPSQFLRDR
jgi:acetyltransferase-like isoleucine patch superfamily enzyme